MKKKQNNWIAAGLLTITTSIATVYSLLVYRESVLIVGIASLLLLLSALWLFTCISKLQKQEPTTSVGKEQRERMNYEGMKLQGEELIRLVNTLGKGTYIYNKRSSEALQELLEHILQAQQTNEQLLHTLIKEHTKAAKFQVKYNQEDTTKVISALTSNCNRLNGNLEKCMDIVRNQSTEVSAMQPDSNVANSLNELSRELAHINTSIQALQLQLSTPVQQPMMYAPVQQAVEPVPVPETAPIAEEPSIIEETPIVEEPSVVEEPSIFEKPSVMETIDESPAIEEAAASADTPDIVSTLSDDPNKQLSADEIAALFAAMG